LTEGGGTDRFSFEDNWDDDVITDFANNGLEKINMTAVNGVTGMSSLTITNTADGALITYLANSILVEGLAASDLDSSDFIFAL
jgi:serralysin